MDDVLPATIPPLSPAKQRRRATKTQAAEQRLRAFKLVIAGHSWEDIARACGYNSAQAAWFAVNSYLKRETILAAAEYRNLQRARYEGLLAALGTQIANGDAQAVTSAVRVLARIDALLGLEIKTPDEVKLAGDSKLVIEVVRKIYDANNPSGVKNITPETAGDT